MHFSQAMILAAATGAELFTGAVAAPAPANATGMDIHSILRDPDQMGCIDWKDTGAGWFAQVHEYHDHCQDKQNGTTAKGSQNQRREVVHGLGDHMSKWKSFGNILGMGAQYACHDSSNHYYGIDSVMRSLAVQACDSITSQTVPGAASNGLWNIWQSYQDPNLSTDGVAGRANFGLQSSGGAPQLTQQLCEAAIDPLLNTVCQVGSNSQGGMMRVSNSGKGNWLTFLADPQTDSDGYH